MNYLEMNNKMVFMIIDCEHSNASVMTIHLKKMGYLNAIIKASAFDALNYLKTNTVDFIICRLKMPNMNGTELLSEIQNDYSISRRPFLLFDEELDEGDLALINEFGADAFLSLPFVTKDLAEKVMKTWHKYINPKDPEYYYEQARKAVLKGQMQEASKVFKALIQSKLLVARCTLGLAKIAMKENRIQDAMKITTMICESHPSYVHGFQFLGEIELSANEPAKAVEHFCKAIEISPKNPYRYQIVSELLAKMELWQPNITILKQAEDQGLEYNFVEEGLARSFMNLKMVDEAIRYYEVLVRRNPKDSATLNNISVCYKKLNEINRSIEYGLKALAVDESNVKVMFNLALSYIAKQKNNEAIKYLKKIVSLDPNFEKAKLKLLELTDSSAYKAELAKSVKIRQNEQTNSDSESIFHESSNSKLVHSAVAHANPTDIDHDNLNSIIKKIAKRVKDREEGKIAPLVLDEKIKAKILAMSEQDAQTLYFNSLMKTRRQFQELMHLWLGSIVEISQELFQQIGEIADEALSTNELSIKKVFEFVSSEEKESHELFGTLRSAMAGDKKLKATLMPILEELDFQDYMAQSIQSLEKIYSIFLRSGFEYPIHEEILKLFINENDRRKYRRIVMGEEVEDSVDLVEGGIISFD